MKTINPNTQHGLILEYIKENPGCTSKEGIKFFEDIIPQTGVSPAFSYLYYSGCIRREKIDGQLRHWYITHQLRHDKKTFKGKSNLRERERVLAHTRTPVEPVLPVLPAGVSINIPVGDGSMTLTIAQAKALSETLGSVFK